MVGSSGCLAAALTRGSAGDSNDGVCFLRGVQRIGFNLA